MTSEDRPMRIPLKLKSFFTEKDTPRWWLIVFAIVLGLAELGRIVYSVHLEQRHLDVREVRKPIEEFFPRAGAYTSAVINSLPDVDQRRANLLDNIRAQYAVLDLMPVSLDEGGTTAVRKYQSALIDMKDVLSKSHDAITLREFYDESQDLYLAQKALVKELE